MAKQRSQTVHRNGGKLRRAGTLRRIATAWSHYSSAQDAAESSGAPVVPATADAWRTLPARWHNARREGRPMTRNVIVLAALATLCDCRSDAPKAAAAKAPTAAGWFEIQTEH